MLRLVLLCMCAVAVPTWAQGSSSSSSNNQGSSGQNTRLFGLGSSLANAFNQVTGNRPTNQFGNNPFGGRPVTGGFGINNGFGGGFNNGFGGGFNNGFGVGGGFGGVSPVQPIGQSQSCRRWCRTPQGQAYCCEGGNEPIQAAITKPGFCPPVRPSCPPTRGFAPPRQCSSDGGCGFNTPDKCCFDTCLQHHTCKPPQGFGR